MLHRIPPDGIRGQLTILAADVESFWAQCLLPDERGCVRWTGCTHRGYGRMKLRKERRQTPAHHIAWALAYGKLPEDRELQVDHTCQITSCVAVAHLEWVTALENQRRIDIRRPVCRRGHDWSHVLPVFRLNSNARICFVCVANPRRRKRSTRPRSKASRMAYCPNAHDVTGDNGYDIDGLPGRRGCWICTHAWKAAM